jgi:hypothetical protein
MPPRKRGTGDNAPVVVGGDDGTERLIHVTISQDHYRWLQQVAEERGSSVAVVSKQVFAQAVTGMQIAKAATVAIEKEN